MCLDAKGVDKIENNEKKEFFIKSCKEYVAQSPDQAPVSEIDSAKSDAASGLKSKKFMTVYTKTMQRFFLDMTNENYAIYRKIADVRDWFELNAERWVTGERKRELLYKYEIKKPKWFVGSFIKAYYWVKNRRDTNEEHGDGTTLSNLSADSLDGAWLDQSPQLQDKKVSKKSCGALNDFTCEKHEVWLDYAINKVCNINAYASACLKNFLVYHPNPNNPNEGPRYLIDPWVPNGVDKNLLIKGANYSEALNAAFQVGKANANNGSKNPGLGSSDYAKFGIVFKNPQDFILNTEMINEIKNKAKLFASTGDVKFFDVDEEDNLKAFADYAYEFHFLNPKLTSDAKIAYPLAGLHPYVSYMANGVAGSMTKKMGGSVATMSNLYKQYLSDYEKTLEAYKDLTINSDGLQKEILETQKDLANITMFTGMLNGSNGAGFSASSRNISGATLSDSQNNFLNAIKNMQAEEKSQVEKLKNFKTNMAKNGNQERLEKVMLASNSYANKISKPLGSSFGGSKSFGSGLAGHSNGKSENATQDGPASSASFNYGSLGVGGGSSYSSSNRRLNIGSGTNRGGTASPEETEAEEKLLVDAIDARDRSKSQYESSDNHTIFEKITNAYIRNYDKILERRKKTETVE